MADQTVSDMADQCELDGEEGKGVVMRLPTSRTEAVQQHRRAGRYPKAIGRIGEARAKRDLAASQDDQERRKEVELLKRCWQNAVAYREHIEGKLHALGAKPPIGEKSYL